MSVQSEKTNSAREAAPKPDFPDEVPIDMEAALDHLDGNRQILRKVLERFLASAPLLLNEARQFAIAGDMIRVRICAHGLKGAAANVCAEPTRRAAENIENMASDNHLENIEAALAELHRQLATLRRHLESETISTAPRLSQSPG